MNKYGSWTLQEDGDPETLVVESEEQNLAKEQVNRCLAFLEPRERNVMRMRHGLHSPEGRGMSLRDIAAAYGLTSERVRQVRPAAPKPGCRSGGGLHEKGGREG